MKSSQRRVDGGAQNAGVVNQGRCGQRSRARSRYRYTKLVSGQSPSDAFASLRKIMADQGQSWVPEDAEMASGNGRCGE